jgi:hypothetical protein
MSLLLLTLMCSALLVQYRCIPCTAGMSSRPAPKVTSGYAAGSFLQLFKHLRLPVVVR